MSATHPDDQGIVQVRTDGRVDVLGSDVALPRIESASNDPFDEVAYTFQSSANAVFVLTVYWSRRLAQVSRIVARRTDGDALNDHIMSRVDNGRGIGFSEFWTADYQLATQSIDNPTMGGGSFGRPGCFGAASTGQYPAYEQQAMLPPQILHRRVLQPSSSELLLESCVVPLEFDIDGRVSGGLSPSQVKGGNRFTGAIYWPCRQFLQVHFGWRGFAKVARIVTWSYCPVEWRAGFGRPGREMINFLGEASTVVHLTSAFRDNAGSYDPVADIFYSVQGQWQASVNTQIVKVWRDRLQTIGDSAGLQVAVLRENVAGVVMESNASFPSGGSMAVGLLGNVHGLAAGPADINNSQEMRLPSHVQASLLNRGLGMLGDGVDYAPFSALQINNSSETARKKGWIGQQAWLCWDTTLTNVCATMKTLAQQKVHREDIPFLVPAHIVKALPELEP